MATTRLGQFGIGLQPYGTFQPKSEAPIVVQDTAPTAAGGITRRRRRYVFPDGTQVIATHDEALDILQRFARQRDEKAPQARRGKRAQVVQLPRQEIERIEWKKAEDTAHELLMPVLPNRVIWEPNRDEIAAVALRLRRKRDEEALIALLI